MHVILIYTEGRLPMCVILTGTGREGEGDAVSTSMTWTPKEEACDDALDPWVKTVILKPVVQIQNNKGYIRKDGSSLIHYYKKQIFPKTKGNHILSLENKKNIKY